MINPSNFISSLIVLHEKLDVLHVLELNILQGDLLPIQLAPGQLQVLKSELKSKIWNLSKTMMTHLNGDHGLCLAEVQGSWLVFENPDSFRTLR